MAVTSSLISGNTAATVNGGGVFTDGALSVSSSRFSGNNATVGAGGGLRVNGANGRADVFRTTFERNTAGTTGGGISVGVNGRLTLTRSLIERNRATSGGGVFIDPGGIFTRSDNRIEKNVTNDCVGTGCT
jgi:predicted outer membrane repeat protein